MLALVDDVSLSLISASSKLMQKYGSPSRYTEMSVALVTLEESVAFLYKLNKTP